MSLSRNLKAETVVTTSVVPDARTASVNGGSLNTQGYEGSIMAIQHVKQMGGTTPTLDGKIQDSADDSAFADVTGLTFAQVTDAADAIEAIAIDPRAVRQYIRVVQTVAGSSPTVDSEACFVGQKKTI